MSKKQMGFTLIEIVMVLVLLGILSAVAVPKYFDLQEQAELNAAKATVAEFQSRLNARFASALLQGKSCSDARTAATAGDASLKGLTGALGADDFGTGWSVAFDTTKTSQLNVTRGKTSTSAGTTYPGTTYASQAKYFEITFPKCDTDDTPASGTGS